MMDWLGFLLKKMTNYICGEEMTNCFVQMSQKIRDARIIFLISLNLVFNAGYTKHVLKGRSCAMIFIIWKCCLFVQRHNSEHTAVGCLPTRCHFFWIFFFLEKKKEEKIVQINAKLNSKCDTVFCQSVNYRFSAMKIKRIWLHQFW